MRILRLIICALVPHMLDGGDHRAVGSGVAPKLVGNDALWHATLVTRQLAEKALGCSPISPALNEDIQHIAGLID